MAIIDKTSLTGHRVVDTDWAGFMEILDTLPERGRRITYDRGKLEVVNITYRHERPTSILSHMLAAMLQDLDIDYEVGGRTTWLRKELNRGFEADDCYWIPSVDKVPLDRDPEIPADPPPDLVIESEMSRTIIKRLPVIAAFGVPEVWRCTRKGEVKIMRLAPSGSYVEVPSSPAIPWLTADDLTRFVALRKEMRISGIVKAFRKWVRERND